MGGSEVSKFSTKSLLMRVSAHYMKMQSSFVKLCWSSEQFLGRVCPK